MYEIYQKLSAIEEIEELVRRNPEFEKNDDCSG
jgi:hypothetical protein